MAAGNICNGCFRPDLVESDFFKGACYCKECDRARARRRYAKKKEHVTAKVRAFRKSNLERVKATERRQYHKHRTVRLRKHGEWHREIKAEAVAAYGGYCKCCGETNITLLNIDHVNNDGKSDRGQNIYSKLKQRDYPKDAYRLLCWSCNIGRHKNGGDKKCPHEEESREWIWSSLAA